MRLEDGNGRGPTKTGMKHSSGETNGSGSNGHAGPHESLPPRPENSILEVAEKVLDTTVTAVAHNTTEVIAETLDVAAKTVSVVGEIDPPSPTEDDVIVQQDAAVRTVVFWVRQMNLMLSAYSQFLSEFFWSCLGRVLSTLRVIRSTFSTISVCCHPIILALR